MEGQFLAVEGLAIVFLLTLPLAKPEYLWNCGGLHSCLKPKRVKPTWVAYTSVKSSESFLISLVLPVARSSKRTACLKFSLYLLLKINCVLWIVLFWSELAAGDPSGCAVYGIWSGAPRSSIGIIWASLSKICSAVGLSWGFFYSIQSNKLCSSRE